MQSQDANPGSAGAVNHPDAEEWMGYLYDEIAPERKRQLHAHLGQCSDCGRQLQQWRSGMIALDEWKLPVGGRPHRRWQPVALLKWAAAAAIVVMAGVAIGRQNSIATGEVTALKATVAELARRVDTECSAASAAREQTLRWLADYAGRSEALQAKDREAIEVALTEMNSRLVKLRTELETVAVNTETGFRQTKEGLTTLASYTVADRGDASDLPKTGNKQQ